MKIDKPRFRYLAGLALLIPPLSTFIFFLGGSAGAVILKAFGVINHGQALFVCLGFAIGGLIVGIIIAAQKIQRAMIVFRTCDEIEAKKE